MKSKRGFTLIELLAVIVILAIIALIATPIILNMINEARKSAAKSSSLGFVDSIEAYAGFAEASKSGTGINLDGYSVGIPGNGEDITCEKTTSGWDNTCKTFMEAVEQKNKGKAPEKAVVNITKNGKVKANSKFYYNKYTCEYNGKEVTQCTSGDSVGASNNNNNQEPEVTFGGTKVAAGTNDTHKGIVYMDPTNLSATCTTGVSTPETKTGCMKFYIYDDSGSNYKMILDHNTTSLIAYDATGPYKEYAQASIKNQVDTDTTGWQAELDPKLITANEVATITGNSGWSSATAYGNDVFCLDTNEKDTTNYCAKSKGTSNYKWLFDYSDGCESYGCDHNDLSYESGGYWTNSSVYGDSYSAWHVDSNGRLSSGDVDGDGYGIRPVITISKSIID